jgi:ribulose-5-phosphate 4-epimerase/fuculose-1-phosphate aldolase
MSWEEEKQEVLAACRRIVAAGLVTGASGNVSRRVEGPGGVPLVAITASQVPYHRLAADDIVVIDFEGNPVEGERAPSSEKLAHLAAYRARGDVRAVIHTHSVYASALAVAGLEIPPLIEEQVILLGGPVPLAEYAIAGSQELGDKACAALGEGNAVLLRNHGMLGVGANLEEAASVCELVERLAQVYVLALGLGRVTPLPESVVELEKKIFRMIRGRLP